MRFVALFGLLVFVACAGPLSNQNLVNEDVRTSDAQSAEQDASAIGADAVAADGAPGDAIMQSDALSADVYDARPIATDSGPADTGPDPDADIGCSGRYPNRCGGSCTDFLTNRFNCGSCGIRCEDAANCVNGTCVRPCPVGEVLCGNTECIQESRIQLYRNCGGRCVEVLGYDSSNCGACGTMCSNGFRCVSGQCGR